MLETMWDENGKNFIDYWFALETQIETGRIIAFTPSGERILGEAPHDSDSKRIRFLTKNLRSPIVEFRKHSTQNI